MVRSEKMNAWMRPTKSSKDFQIALGAHMMYGGKSAIRATIMLPAKTLPKSRSASDSGFEMSSFAYS